MAKIFQEINPQDPESETIPKPQVKEFKRKRRECHHDHQQEQQQKQQQQQQLDQLELQLQYHERRKNQRYRSVFSLQNGNAAVITKIFIVFILGTIVVHRIISTIMSRKKWINAPITCMHRQCPQVHYETMTPAQAAGQKICLTILTDSQSNSIIQRFLRWRNFDGIVELTWPNKLEYAMKHGYRLHDQSSLINTSRPPAWSKIAAVLDLLSDEHQCDWVMWLDADTVIMNSDIKITSFLPANNSFDMLVASDKGGGYNSGVFLFRNTEWSKQLLRQWWNKTSYVRPPGLSLSGDNNAMKDLLRKLTDFNDHVLAPVRCTFNSFAEFLTLAQSWAIMDKLKDQTWYMDNEHYHKGDFIAHTPGFDNKAEILKLLLDEASHRKT